MSELRKKELEDEKKWIEIELKGRVGEQRFNDWSRMVEMKGEVFSQNEGRAAG